MYKRQVLGKCTAALPFEVISSKESREALRMKYRFLDLRNRKVHRNIVLRAQLLSFLRSKMEELGFLEIQTPILTASSPEGARDYLIPSRKHCLLYTSRRSRSALSDRNATSMAMQ